jgi:hypothetical protein
MEFDRKFSIGNVWTIGVVLVGLVAGWMQFGSDIQTNAKDTATLAIRVTNLETNFHALLKQLGDERVTQTRILTEIQSDLKYLKER